MKFNKKLLIICIAIPLLVGGLSALISNSAMDDFMKLDQPPLSPPSWLFPVVWTILYTLMGVSLYLVLVSDAEQRVISTSITLFTIQLIFNFFWSIWFFNFGLFFFAFAWILALLVLIIAMVVVFSRASKLAAYLNIPYILWVAFATYLNLGIALLN